MLRLKDVMTASPVTIESDQPLSAAAAKMQRFGIRHLPVVSGGHIVGVLSERDLWLRRAVEGRFADDCSVASAMASPPFCLDAGASVAEASEQMAVHKFGCVIVTAQGRVTGIVTAVDLLAALVAITRRPASPAAGRTA